ncbi:MAG: indole-3-glycerol phosphate synthase TrpC [Desulfuromonadaceae bacterium]|nr:indole-3-glycerol phosphate synthase TrpC [Desulfuromonadaceae bacterium]
MILDGILERKREEVAAAKKVTSPTELREWIEALAPTRGFAAALRRMSERGTAIIAEIKKGSPSKGIIRSDFDPVAIARCYERGGAAALSILTDEHFFFGRLDFLSLVAKAVSLPLLRKDFIIDSFQLLEARAYGADAVLLIAAALPARKMTELAEEAHNLGLDVLLEVHDEKELATALAIPADLLGINNRSLNTFHTDLAVTERLLPQIPPGRLVVSESGIHCRADIDRLLRAGARAFLVGESLMREKDVTAPLAALLNDRGGRS